MATTKPRPRPADRRVHYPDAVDPDWMRPKGVPGPEQFHLKGTQYDHDQQSHGGGGSTWTHGGGKRLTVKKSDAKRKMSRREALSASQKIADDVARYFGDTPGKTKAPEPSQWLEQGEVVESDAIDTARADKSGALLVNPTFLDRMADPEFGVADFRVVAHEAVHAYVSGSPYTYEGHSSTYEEGAAELLSLRYWHDQGQPYTDLDAVRPPETAVGTGRWTTDPVDHLAASTVYGDEVIETARRAASAVGGWDDRDAVFAEVERVMRSDGNGRLDFRDSTDPDFALPDGVEHPDSYDTARTLVRYLLAGDVGPFRRRDGEKMSVEFGYDPFYDDEKLSTRGGEMRRTRQFHLAGTQYDHDQSTHGGGGGPNFDNLKPLAEPDGGFTLDAAQLRPMTTGWAVAITGSDRLMLAEDAFDADGEPTPELVRLTMDRIEAAKAAQPVDGTELALGGWHNPADGKVEVNVTFVFPADQEARARQFAIDNDQIAMANLDAIAAEDWANAIVQTGGTGGDRDADKDRKDR